MSTSNGGGMPSPLDAPLDIPKLFDVSGLQQAFTWVVQKLQSHEQTIRAQQERIAALTDARPVAQNGDRQFQKLTEQLSTEADQAAQVLGSIERKMASPEGPDAASPEQPPSVPEGESPPPHLISPERKLRSAHGREESPPPQLAPRSQTFVGTTPVISSLSPVLRPPGDSGTVAELQERVSSMQRQLHGLVAVLAQQEGEAAPGQPGTRASAHAVSVLKSDLLGKIEKLAKGLDSLKNIQTETDKRPESEGSAKSLKVVESDKGSPAITGDMPFEAVCQRVAKLEEKLADAERQLLSEGTKRRQLTEKNLQHEREKDTEGSGSGSSKGSRPGTRGTPDKQPDILVVGAESRLTPDHGSLQEFKQRLERLEVMASVLGGDEHTEDLIDRLRDEVMSGPEMASVRQLPAKVAQLQELLRQKGMSPAPSPRNRPRSDASGSDESAVASDAELTPRAAQQQAEFEKRFQAVKRFDASLKYWLRQEREVVKDMIVQALTNARDLEDNYDHFDLGIAEPPPPPPEAVEGTGLPVAATKKDVDALKRIIDDNEKELKTVKRDCQRLSVAFSSFRHKKRRSEFMEGQVVHGLSEGDESGEGDAGSGLRPKGRAKSVAIAQQTRIDAIVTTSESARKSRIELEEEEEDMVQEEGDHAVPRIDDESIVELNEKIKRTEALGMALKTDVEAHKKKHEEILAHTHLLEITKHLDSSSGSEAPSRLAGIMQGVRESRGSSNGRGPLVGPPPDAAAIRKKPTGVFEGSTGMGVEGQELSQSLQRQINMDHHRIFDLEEKMKNLEAFELAELSSSMSTLNAEFQVLSGDVTDKAGQIYKMKEDFGNLGLEFKTVSGNLKQMAWEAKEAVKSLRNEVLYKKANMEDLERIAEKVKVMDRSLHDNRSLLSGTVSEEAVRRALLNFEDRLIGLQRQMEATLQFAKKGGRGMTREDAELTGGTLNKIDEFNREIERNEEVTAQLAKLQARFRAMTDEREKDAAELKKVVGLTRAIQKDADASTDHLRRIDAVLKLHAEKFARHATVREAFAEFAQSLDAVQHRLDEKDTKDPMAASGGKTRLAKKRGGQPELGEAIESLKAAMTSAASGADIQEQLDDFRVETREEMARQLRLFDLRLAPAFDEVRDRLSRKADAAALKTKVDLTDWQKLKERLEDFERYIGGKDGFRTLLSRKPLQGTLCASCDREIDQLATTTGGPSTWKKLPPREPPPTLPPPASSLPPAGTTLPLIPTANGSMAQLDASQQHHNVGMPALPPNTARASLPPVLSPDTSNPPHTSRQAGGVDLSIGGTPIRRVQPGVAGNEGEGGAEDEGGQQTSAGPQAANGKQTNGAAGRLPSLNSSSERWMPGSRRPNSPNQEDGGAGERQEGTDKVVLAITPTPREEKK
ncbi:unnamed protein product [Vitrella brassicaformis CCMP3155]|uniref:Uncharacterized protein n=2 Tax=Vitrella brassicaformis TaxID=1169539 RepID=A0A0G4F8Z4_VITBC|nr:unnamed protein product [Vitrella brassicaformis CCMP3155]|eukprot:CEM08683.1 unnamed protein product [Vitrella brassicaformis CCMP3155]